jgi:hypothetical protein
MGIGPRKTRVERRPVCHYAGPRAFFCAPRQDATTLEAFVGQWKQWTAKRMIKELGVSRPVWQLEFNDHLIRSEESCAEKWDYVYRNPVRAGLVVHPEDWPYCGEIVADSGPFLRDQSVGREDRGW